MTQSAVQGVPLEPIGKTDFIDAFDPKAYLVENFLQPDDEDRFTAQFLFRAYKSLPNDLKILEFGGGPSLFTVFTYVEKAREIHFSDFVPASLDEVNLWLEGDSNAFDWRAHIQLILDIEGIPVTEPNISARTNQARNKITTIFLCDGRKSSPIGEHHQLYDLVSAHHCTDVAAVSNSEWPNILRNVTSLVKPGGWLVISVTTGSLIYTENGYQFACVSLTADEIRYGYQLSGFNMETLRLQEMIIPQAADREYSGLMIAIAQKPAGMV